MKQSTYDLIRGLREGAKYIPYRCARMANLLRLRYKYGPGMLRYHLVEVGRGHVRPW